MTLRYAINQEVFTNSLLIYPHFDESDIFEFYWQRRDSFFFGSSEQRIKKRKERAERRYKCREKKRGKGKRWRGRKKKIHIFITLFIQEFNLVVRKKLNGSIKFAPVYRM